VYYGEHKLKSEKQDRPGNEAICVCLFIHGSGGGVVGDKIVLTLIFVAWRQWGSHHHMQKMCSTNCIPSHDYISV